MRSLNLGLAVLLLLLVSRAAMAEELPCTCAAEGVVVTVTVANRWESDGRYVCEPRRVPDAAGYVRR